MKISATSADLYALTESLPLFHEGKKHLPNNHLLLTGATGFLGIHLLENLVKKSIYEKIYIIVRNKNKLLDQIEYYNIPKFSFNKIEIIEGDLLTLPIENFPNASYVIHSAAEIHCLKNLSQLWSNNVLVTKKICDIYQHCAKVTLISTLSVFVSSNTNGEHKPTSLPVNQNYSLYGGYAQSKYISEKLVEKINGNIVRLGLLTGSTHTGKFPPHDFFTQIVTALNNIKVYPEIFEEAFVDITPVDLCGQIITNYISNNNFSNNNFNNNNFSKNNIIHIANKNSLPLSAIVKKLNLTPVSGINFISTLNSLPSLTKTLLMFAFFKSEMLKSSFKLFNIDLFQSTDHSYDIKEDFNINHHHLLTIYLQQLVL